MLLMPLPSHAVPPVHPHGTLLPRLLHTVGCSATVPAALLSHRTSSVAQPPYQQRTDHE